MSFRDGTRFFHGFHHARCVKVFVEDENESKALWAVFAGITRKLSFRPLWDFCEPVMTLAIRSNRYQLFGSSSSLDIAWLENLYISKLPFEIFSNLKETWYITRNRKIAMFGKIKALAKRTRK